MNASTPKKRENAWLWLLEILAGLLIVIILGIHIVVNHVAAPGGLLSYQDVIVYYQNPWVVAMEVFFLVVVVSHALLGLRSILLDLDPSDAALRAINVLFLALGAAAIGYGIWLALTLAQRAP
jgi:succinate dehydrogenase hydrophobic anchor subunit